MFVCLFSFVGLRRNLAIIALKTKEQKIETPILRILASELEENKFFKRDLI